MTRDETRDVARVVETVGEEPWLEVLTGRFGMPREVFADYLVFRRTASSLSIVRRGLRPPLAPEPASIGIPFFYLGMRHPRPTSAAAILFGPHATRNVLDLGDDRVPDFVFGREISLEGDDAGAVDGPGYVLGRYRGDVVGLGHCRREGERGLVLRGMVPKAWAAQIDGHGDGRSA